MALGSDSMAPRFLPVKRRVRESADVISLEIAADDPDVALSGFKPGQFNMLYAFGVGEIPVSMSGDPADSGKLVHTIRAVGPVSSALATLKPAGLLGLRGPFGAGWPIAEASGADILIVAGGIGLAPLRPVIYHVLSHRDSYGRVALLYGARSPWDLLYRHEIDRWRRLPGFQLRVTVDRAEKDWPGDVGVVTALLPKIRINPADTVAMICGPEIMIRFTAAALRDLGVDDDRIHVSLERNMKCAVGFCGHCQFGGRFICKDGPVFRYDRVRDLLAIREL